MTPPGEEMKLVERCRVMAKALERDNLPNAALYMTQQSDLIEQLVGDRDRAVGALTEIARLRTNLSGDFSMASKQSDKARAFIDSLGER